MCKSYIIVTPSKTVGEELVEAGTIKLRGQSDSKLQDFIAPDVATRLPYKFPPSRMSLICSDRPTYSKTAKTNGKYLLQYANTGIRMKRR